MTRLPRAILFDLDDTIISAYGRPERAWAAVRSRKHLKVMLRIDGTAS